MSQTAIEFQNVTKQFDNAALPSDVYKRQSLN